MGAPEHTKMSTEEQDAVKGRLLEIIQGHVGQDTAFVDIRAEDNLPSKISEEIMTQLRQEPIVEGYKLFVKAVILQVNGMASSTNTLWAVDGKMRDMNLSVSWTNDARCSVWVTVVANPNPPVMPDP